MTSRPRLKRHFQADPLELIALFLIGLPPTRSNCSCVIIRLPMHTAEFCLSIFIVESGCQV